MEACQARGRDIIIIATEMGVTGGPVTRRYLNVPPSPDTSPVSCMSPSDIILKTGSPNSPEGDVVFNFRGTSEWTPPALHQTSGRRDSFRCHIRTTPIFRVTMVTSSSFNVQPHYMKIRRIKWAFTLGLCNIVLVDCVAFVEMCALNGKRAQQRQVQTDDPDSCCL